ncbi:PadR family transcriptional regulator [Actinoplanes sp. NEAU-A12]|uniref:PadR family transcriptional regulator n=1 Tax=Actinoplanes sandaracinus TaxID=3045177 RepID=A0ABT6WRZ9_9ACTN|nr:PadR family transcriptional regulator [Actinoplanes sandaracinus]MDI6102456.1 PadR family transcriptional regulator [Actinoplanes sandaracinus]
MSAPMREPTFWILAALAPEPRHGYGVIREVARLSTGHLTLQAGTLYAALDRLTAQGLVEPDREEVVDGRPRRYYRLTSDGAAALDAEAERRQRSAEAATAQLAARRRFGLGPVSP